MGGVVVQDNGTGTGVGTSSNIATAWDSFFNKAQTDQNFRQALMQFGSQMMQPLQPGQTFGGNLGSALGASAMYLAKLRAADEAQKQKDAEAALEVAKMKELQKTGEAQRGLVSAQTNYYQERAGKTAAEAGQVGVPKVGQGGGKPSAKVQQLNTLRDAILGNPKYGLDKNNPADVAAATITAQQMTQSNNPYSQQQKASADLIKAATLPGQEQGALAALQQQQQDPVSYLLNQNRQNTSGTTEAKAAAKSTGLDLSSATGFDNPKTIKVKIAPGDIREMQALGETGQSYLAVDATGKKYMIAKTRVLQ